MPSIHPCHTGVVDDSGLRLFYTEKLRTYDAGTLTVGHSVNPNMIIPPRQTWKTVGHCSGHCTEEVRSQPHTHTRNKAEPVINTLLLCVFFSNITAQITSLSPLCIEAGYATTGFQVTETQAAVMGFRPERKLDKTSPHLTYKTDR